MKMYDWKCFRSRISVARIEVWEEVSPAIYRRAKIFFEQRIRSKILNWRFIFVSLYRIFLLFPNFFFLLSFCRVWCLAPLKDQKEGYFDKNSLLIVPDVLFLFESIKRVPIIIQTNIVRICKFDWKFIIVFRKQYFYGSFVNSVSCVTIIFPSWIYFLFIANCI